MIVRGIVDEILYEDHTGFSVMRVRQNKGLIRTVGSLGKVHKGETWNLEGELVVHPIHGEQLKVKSGYPILPEMEDELVALLSGDLFDGIGPSTASCLVKAYGKELWDILENRPFKLFSDGFVTNNKAALIMKSVDGLRTQWEIIRFLVELRLPTRLVHPLSVLFRGETISQIKDNPYRLLSFESWSEVDRVAIELGIAKNDVKRLQAGLVHILQKYLLKGHTALTCSFTLTQASKLLKVATEELKEVLKEPLVSFSSEDLVQLPGIASQEKTVAAVFSSMMSTFIPLADHEWVENWLDTFDDKQNIYLHKNQREAVIQAVSQRFLIITGGAGTGKTSVIKAICSILEELGQDVLLSAPTGRASKRLQESTQKETKTLHRTFGYNERNFDFDETNKHIPTLIIDESSMVDLRLWSIVASCLKEESRLILVGDPHQLPPVGAGQIFTDLINHPQVPIVHLTKIHRQASDNPIPYVSNDIKNGVIPTLLPWIDNKKGVFLMTVDDEQEGSKTVVNLMVDSLPKIGIPIDEIQVLSPIKNGAVGTKFLNMLIRQELGKNNVSPHIPFSIGDRIIQIVNNYDLGQDGIMNGSNGFIIDVYPEGALVDFDGEQVMVKGYDLFDLEYAYSISVHKSQGSQYKVVIIPLYPSARALLNRQLVYTAMTRATDLVIFVGTKETLEQALRNSSISQRLSAFNYHFKKAIELTFSSGGR